MALYLGSKKVSPTKTITKEVSSMKPFFDAGGKCAYSIATSFDGAIQYDGAKKQVIFLECGNNMVTLSQIKIPVIHTRDLTKRYIYGAKYQG